MVVTGFEESVILMVAGPYIDRVSRAAVARKMPATVVAAVKRHPLAQLSVAEQKRLKQLIEEGDWSTLLGLEPADATRLAHQLDAQVLLSVQADDPSPRARDVAAVILGEILSALDPRSAMAALSYQVRQVSDSQRGYAAELQGSVDRVERGVGAVLVAINRRDGQVNPDVLLRGPLEALDLLEEHNAAQLLIAEDPGEAAERLGRIVARLEETGNDGGLATPIRRQRAELLDMAGDGAGSAAAWMPLIRAAIDSGDCAGLHLPGLSLARLAAMPDAPEWMGHRAKAVEVAGAWFRDVSVLGGQLLEPAVAAWQEGDPEGPWLLMVAAEMSLAIQDFEAIAAVQTPLEEAAAAAEGETGTRLRLVLADALRDEERWAGLVAGADLATATLSPKLCGLILARRGRYLTWAGRPAEARVSYRRAVSIAALQHVHLPEDAAQWLRAWWELLVRYFPDDPDLFELGSRIRAVRASGSGGFLTQVGQSHVAGLGYLREGKLREALPPLRALLHASCWTGHLGDELEAYHLLGCLLEQAGEDLRSALAHLVLAGEDADATRLGGNTVEYLDVASLATHLERRVRTAALAAAAAQADLIPDGEVDRWVSAALDATAGERTGVGPQEWVNGFKVLAALSHRLPAGRVDEVLAAVEALIPRQPQGHGYADEWLLKTLVGLAVANPDRRDKVAECLLAIIDVSDHLARQLLNQSEAIAACWEQLRAPLLERADSGSRPAIHLLASQREQADVVVDAVEEELSQVVAAAPTFGPGYNALLVSAARPAVLSRCLPVERQEAVARDLALRAQESEDLIGNRTQYLQGVEFLASGLSEAVRAELFSQVLPIARGEISSSEADVLTQQHNRPLSIMRLGFGDPADLQRAAVRAVAALAFNGQQAEEAATTAQMLARTGRPADTYGAAQALFALQSRGLVVDVPWQFYATSEVARLRQMAAALVPYQTDLDNRVVEELARDSSVAVRRELAEAVAAMSDVQGDLAQSLVEILILDGSFSVRARIASSLRLGIG